MSSTDEWSGQGSGKRAQALDARERAVDEREESAVTKEELLRLREELVYAREEAADARGLKDRLMADLKEANERLIVASIRSDELADIAERARRRLEASERELLEAAGFRERLIGIVSHDLRAPLAAVQIALDLLARQSEVNDDGKRLVAIIRRSTGRMGDMIGQLLDFTRAHLGGGLSLAPRPTDLQEVCHRIVDELELGHQMPGRFVCEFRGDLTGTWDPDRLAQVVSNLGENAIAHGAPDTPVLLRVQDEGDAVLLEMNNRGTAIPLALLPVVFDPFRRADQPSHSRGLGLGLYISHQIVGAHGGSIAVRSDEAEGTTFSIRLPRRPPPPQAARPRP